ncbi:MAG: hypothetical protein ABIP53_07745 [Candidatus Limnocylindrales bacterium]
MTDPLDYQLRSELERRAAASEHGHDWARRELLPVVRAAIDTRPQRVTTSRMPAFGGLLAAAAALLVLVELLPRLNPGPAALPTSQETVAPTSVAVAPSAVSPTPTQPSSAPATPTPRALGIVECSGNPAVTVTDFIGELVNCDSESRARLSGIPEPTVSNPEGDLHRLDITWSSSCVVDVGVSFRATTTGSADRYQVSVDQTVSRCRGPAAIYVLHLHLTRDVAAQIVDAMVAARPVATPTPAPSPTTAAAVVIDCKPSDDPSISKFGHATISDPTGLVESCEAVAPKNGNVQVANPGGDLRILEVDWTGRPCDSRADFNFSSLSGDGYLVHGILYDIECRETLVGHGLLIHLRHDVSAVAVLTIFDRRTFVRNPPPDGRLACPYPFDTRHTDINVLDHTGLLTSCVGLIEVTDPGPDPTVATFADESAGEALAIGWRVSAVCTDMPVFVEIWPPAAPSETDQLSLRYTVQVDLRAPDPATTEPCGDGFGSQSVQLFGNEAIPGDRVDVVVTRQSIGSAGTEVEAGHFFNLTLQGVATYAPGAPIDITTELIYDGPTESLVVSGVGNLIKGFGVRQLDGPLSVGASWNEPCLRDSLERGLPHTEPFRKSGGFDPQDPHADFYRSYFTGPDLQLPAGAWLITAYSDFFLGGSCGGERILLEPSIVIHVE